MAMKAAWTNRIRNRNGKRDLLGILLALVVGFGGQLFMLNPIRILTPALPMLTRHDWPSGRVAQGLEILWSSAESRNFFIRMEYPKESLDEYPPRAYIEQRTSWYADTNLPRDFMQYEIDANFRNKKPVAQSSLSTDKPASRLYCQDYGNVYMCTYLANTDHWLTKVVMFSKGDEYLSFSEMQLIIGRIDQLLLAAPEKP